MSGWGQAHINNTIGFGQGSTNNSVNWGSSYGNSFSGDTALASGGGFTGLLDDYPGAAAGYSLRQLSSSYTGSAIEVRREPDNAVAQIGFVNNELDTASLLAFANGGNGNAFVARWYDQSGNGNDATQGSAANQPQIVSSGSLILENGKPSISFDGVNDYLIFQAIPNLSGLDNASYSLVFTPNNVNQDSGIFQHNVDLVNYVALGLGDLGTSPRVGSRLVLSNSVVDSNGYDASVECQNVFIKVERLSPSIQLTNNGVDAVDVYQTRSGGAIVNTIGAANAAANFYASFTLQEFVNWQVNVFASQSGIEANTNNYYTIYP